MLDAERRDHVLHSWSGELTRAGHYGYKSASYKNAKTPERVMR
jgi:hypothetical protein